MQVFIVGSPLETAMALDPKRLRKQIIECGQIFDALKGNRAWSNHPCVLQYREYMQWLYEYMQCLMEYNRGRKNTPLMYSNFANEITPPRLAYARILRPDETQTLHQRPRILQAVGAFGRV